MTYELKLKDRADYLLQEWVNQNSFTENLSGIRSILDQVSDEADSMGLAKEWIPSSHEQGLPTLRIRTQHFPSRTPQIRLFAHADTPFDEHSSLQLITWTQGRLRAIGPGVLGNKGGILVGLLALNLMKQQKSPPMDIELWVLPHSHHLEDHLQQESGEGPRLWIPLLPSAMDRHVSFNAAAEPIQKVVTKLIEHHEGKKAQSLQAPYPRNAAILGLGPVGSGAGTVQETLEMSSLFSRANIIRDLSLNWVF